MRRFLGEGAKKRVYLAHDTKLDRDVAFALIKTDGLDADTKAAAHEQLRAALRAHETPEGVRFGSGAWLISATKA